MAHGLGSRLSLWGRFAFALLLLPLWLAIGPAAAETQAFARVRSDVAQRWPNVTHVPAAEFARLMEGGALVLDVRSKEEYAVSHIAGAVQVDPDISKAAFRDQLAEKARGRPVLVYCSVGVRSSKLATLIASEVASAGGTSLGNLAGGIFGWHNEGRPLVDANGPTEFVHAYSASWGKVLSRPELMRTEPVSPR